MLVIFDMETYLFLWGRREGALNDFLDFENFGLQKWFNIIIISVKKSWKLSKTL